MFGMESLKQVTPAEQVLEAKSLPQGTSAQLVELVDLTRALEPSKGQRINIYMDSKYVYLTTCSCCNMERESLKQQQENLLNISERSDQETFNCYILS